MKHFIISEQQKETLANLLYEMENESKKKKIPSIYDQVKKVNSAYMSAAAGIGGTLGEGAEPEADAYSIGYEGNVPNDLEYAHVVDEERGVSLSNDTDAIDSLVQEIISNIGSWETPENQVDITTANAVSGIHQDAPKTLTQKDRKLKLQTSEGDIKVIQRVYNFDVPEEITGQIPFIAKMKMSIQAIDYTPINPDDIEKLKRVLSSRSTHGGYGNGKYTKVGPDGKTNYATSKFTIQTVSGEVVNPSSVYGIIYHEMGHAKTDNMQMSRGEDKMGSNPVDYWSHRHNAQSMMNGLEYEKAFAVLIYRFWEPDEMNQGAAQIFGDLKGLGDSDATHFNNNLKKTDTGKELVILRQAFDTLSSKPEWSQSVWDRCIVPKYNDKEGFLRFRSSASIYDKEKGSWVKTSPRNKTLTFQQFMKQTKKKMDDYMRKIGRSASLYYDKVNEDVNPEDIDLSSFEVKKELNPRFWKDERLDSRIRIRLLDIADDFWDFVGVDWVRPDDVIMTGSLANFNWDEKFSDIDLHLMVDFKKVDRKTSFVKEYFNSKKNLWNEEHDDITIYGFPVELYVQDIHEKHAATAVYSLDKDKWLTEPDITKLSDKDLHTDKVKKSASDWMNIIDELEDNLADAESQKDYEDVMLKGDEIASDLKKERQDSLEAYEGEINDGNIVYKTLRRNGYLDKLYSLKTDAYNLMVSLNESMEKKANAYVMVGIPGAGKSTWIKQNHPDLPVVSRDIIRGELGFSSGADEKIVGTKDQENEVTRVEDERIKEYCLNGQDFIIDDTNTGKYRANLISLLRQCNAKIVMVHLDTDLDTCIKRREGQIPADIMRRIHANFIPPKEGEYDELINE